MPIVVDNRKGQGGHATYKLTVHRRGDSYRGREEGAVVKIRGQVAQEVLFLGGGTGLVGGVIGC